MASNEHMQLRNGASPMATTGGTPWANDHFNMAAEINASTTKHGANSVTKRLVHKFQKYASITNASAPLTHLTMLHDLVELLRRIDEPLLFLMPHEDSTSLTKFCDSSANAGGNENQQRLVANASLTTMVNDLLDALFESNSGLSAAIRSARTPATKIMEALDCLGLRPERIIKTCQAYLTAPGTSAMGESPDTLNVPGWKSHFTLCVEVLDFFKYRRDNEDKDYLATHIDSWERLLGSIKFNKVFDPHLADLRGATGPADLINKVKSFHLQLQSNEDDDTIPLETITTGSVHRVGGGGSRADSRPPASDACHGCGKSGCRITKGTCPKHGEWLERKRRKAESHQRRRDDARDQRQPRKKRPGEGGSAKGPNPYVKQPKKECFYKFSCNYLGNGCPFSHGGSLDAVKAAFASKK
jgi:hypothetical protein